MKNKADLREIAELNGLTYAESTSGTNGYPSNIKGIIIGFDNFKEAEEIQEIPGPPPAINEALTLESFKILEHWELKESILNIKTV